MASVLADQSAKLSIGNRVGLEPRMDAAGKSDELTQAPGTLHDVVLRQVRAAISKKSNEPWTGNVSDESELMRPLRR